VVSKYPSNEASDRLTHGERPIYPWALRAGRDWRAARGASLEEFFEMNAKAENRGEVQLLFRLLHSHSVQDARDATSCFALSINDSTGI